MSKMKPELFSSPAVLRCRGGAPVLSRADVPYPADCVFNAGVTRYRGQYVCAFRADSGYDGHGGFDRCVIGLAFSRDGVRWTVQDRPFLTPEDLGDPEITRVYDPRLTVIDGDLYLCFAADTRHGLRGGIAVVRDLARIELKCLTVPDNRNLVLFPEKIGGRYVRLERPFPVYSRGGVDRFDIWISYSRDLEYWGDSRLLLRVEDVPFANDKIGPGAPPIRTDKGWLTLFHTVDIDRSRGKNGWEDKWQKRYCAGVMLLDLEDPSRVIGLCKTPLLAPETRWEMQEGYRTNVIFPGGLVPEDDGTVKIYYGASDTVECLATARIDDLLALCRPAADLPGAGH